MKKILVLFFISLMVFICGCLSQEVKTTPAPIINSLEEFQPYTQVCKNQFWVAEAIGSYGKNYRITCERNVTLPETGEMEIIEKNVFFGHLLEDLSLSKEKVLVEAAMSQDILFKQIYIYPQQEKLRIEEMGGITYLIGDKPYNIYLCGECKKGDRVLVITSTVRFESIDAPLPPPTGQDLIDFLNLGKG